MAITKISAAMADLDGAVTINNSGADADFIVEGDGNTHALFVQASDDKIGLGHSSPPNRLTILGDKDQTSSGVYGGNTKWGLLAETPNYADGDYVGLIASTTGDNNATKPKFGIWGLHSNSGSRLYLSASSDYGTGLNVTWGLKENGNFGPLTSGHGIDFSATSNATGASSEILDDYEEGTWTPTINSGTLSAAQCTYTKIGNMVTLRANISDISDNTFAGDIQISGLPYTAGNTNRGVGSVLFRYFSKTNASHMVSYINPNGTLIYLYWSFNSSDTWTPVHFEDGTQANTDVILNISYIV